MIDEHDPTGEAPSASPVGVSEAVAAPNRRVHASAKTVLVGSTRFLGPGVVQLLEAVGSTGSVKRACESMGMSYTKGWRLIHTLEGELGAQCVSRHQGGVGGGRASLTPECRELLGRFAAFTRDADVAVAQLFAQHFPDLAERG